MSPLELTTIRRKLARMAEDLTRLKELAERDAGRWDTDAQLRAAGERWLQTCIEAAMDLNASLLVGLGHGAPDSGYSSFLDLADKTGVISRELARELAPSAGLRNRLVHRYDDLDSALVLAGVRKAVEFFPGYVAAVAAFLDDTESR